MHELGFGNNLGSAMLFCCEAPEMFCRLQRKYLAFHQHGCEWIIPEFLILVNLSFNNFTHLPFYAVRSDHLWHQDLSLISVMHLNTEQSSDNLWEQNKSVVSEM